MNSTQDLRNNVAGVICVLALIINLIYIPIYLLGFYIFIAYGPGLWGVFFALLPVIFLFIVSRSIFKSISKQDVIYTKKGQEIPINSIAIGSGIYNLIIGIIFYFLIEYLFSIVVIISALFTIIAGFIYQKYTASTVSLMLSDGEQHVVKIEDLDGSSTNKCPHCGWLLSTDAEKCPKCGKELWKKL